jgi:hypothetical protein
MRHLLKVGILCLASLWAAVDMVAIPAEQQQQQQQSLLAQTTSSQQQQQTNTSTRPRNFLSLSAGNPPPLTTINMSISNAGPGASAVGQTAGTTPFTAGANYGDLSLVSNGQPAVAILGLRVQGDLSYQVLMAQLNFTASNLQYRGVDVSGNQDRGSFIRIFAGTPISASPNTNIQGTTINPALSGEGLALSQIAFGQATINYATLVFSGTSPTSEKSTTSNTPFTMTADGIVIGNTNRTATGSTTAMTGQIGAITNGSASTSVSGTGTGGNTSAGASTTNINSMPNQAMSTLLGAMTPSSVMNQMAATGTTTNSSNLIGTIDVPVYFQAPTGFALGPLRGPSPGIFTTQLQFAIFPRP